VRHVGGESAFLTGDVGRGRMFLWTDRKLPFENLERYSITLPVIGESLGVKAEVVHRCSVPGSGRRGAGLRFHGFDTDGEARWIRYLRSLEHIPTA